MQHGQPMQVLRGLDQAESALRHLWLARTAGAGFAYDGYVTPRPYDIRERTFLFAREVIDFSRLLDERGPVARRLVAQLVSAAASVGANVEEAADAQSKADFVNKCSIALKECREARYWLRLIAATHVRLKPAALALIQESGELVAILQTIVFRARKSASRGKQPDT